MRSNKSYTNGWFVRFNFLILRKTPSLSLSTCPNLRRWCYDVRLMKRKKLFVLSFVIGLKANIKREVKAHPLYSLNVAYQKGLDYEKYLRVVLWRVPFNPHIHPSHPRTFPRSHLVLNLSTLHHYYDLLLVHLLLAWLWLQHLFRLVLALLYPKSTVTSHIVCRCRQHALVISCVEDNLFENTDELLVMDPVGRETDPS